MVVCGENSQERRVFVVVSGVITFIKKKEKKERTDIPKWPRWHNPK